MTAFSAHIIRHGNEKMKKPFRHPKDNAPLADKGL